MSALSFFFVFIIVVAVILIGKSQIQYRQLFFSEPFENSCQPRPPSLPTVEYPLKQGHAAELSQSNCRDQDINTDILLPCNPETLFRVLHWSPVAAFGSWWSSHVPSWLSEVLSPLRFRTALPSFLDSQDLDTFDLSFH